MSWVPLVSSLAVLAIGGCVQESVTADESSGTDGDDSFGDTFGDPELTTSGSTGQPEGSTGEPEPEFVPYPARGIQITEVFANQGVQVPVVSSGGEWVSGAGRNAAMFKGRNTLIRGLWQLAPDFEPRKLEARLTLSYPDGSEEVAWKKIDVSEDSKLVKLDTNAWFMVPGELIVPQMKFQLQLFETDWGYEELPEPELAGYPSKPDYLGIESADMKLRVVMVPVKHDLGPDCPDAPELTEDAMSYLADQLYQQNPVGEVELIPRDVYTYTSSMSSFGGLLGAMADLRVADGAPPDVYYYGLVRACDGGPDGVGGQAISIPSFPTQDNAWTRTSVGRFYAGLSATANTFVHEVGHTQGRRHIHCNGDEGGTDPSYPYELGDIGVWGFGVLDFTLYTPTNAKDYMTYCGSTWVSDWGWQKVVPFIEEITSWETEAPSAEPSTAASQRLLVGLFDEHTGEETWFVTYGTNWGRAANPADVFEIDGPSGRRVLSSTLGQMGDGGYNVAVELPDDVMLSEAIITRIRGEQRYEIPRMQLQDPGFTLAP